MEFLYGAFPKVDQNSRVMQYKLVGDFKFQMKIWYFENGYLKNGPKVFQT